MKGMVNTMTIQERVSYIKGMMEGMNFEADTNEKKLILAITELLEEMSNEIESIEEDADYLNEYIEELDEDLGDLEEYIYDEEDEDDDDDEDYEEVCDLECDCGSFVEISTENIKDGKIVCPDCGKEYTLEEVCGDCDCCCGC